MVGHPLSGLPTGIKRNYSLQCNRLHHRGVLRFFARRTARKLMLQGTKKPTHFGASLRRCRTAFAMPAVIDRGGRNPVHVTGEVLLIRRQLLPDEQQIACGLRNKKKAR
jgi:hypothetical protein